MYQSVQTWYLGWSLLGWRSFIIASTGCVSRLELRWRARCFEWVTVCVCVCVCWGCQGRRRKHADQGIVGTNRIECQECRDNVSAPFSTKNITAGTKVMEQPHKPEDVLPNTWISFLWKDSRMAYSNSLGKKMLSTTSPLICEYESHSKTVPTMQAFHIQMIQHRHGDR